MLVHQALEGSVGTFVVGLPTVFTSSTMLGAFTLFLFCALVWGSQATLGAVVCIVVAIVILETMAATWADDKESG
jgi:hypothetical protein